MRGDEDVSVTATVRVELEVEAGSSWGGDCSMGQVHKQATDVVLARVAAVAREAGLRVLPSSLAVIAVRVLAVRKDRR